MCTCTVPRVSRQYWRTASSAARAAAGLAQSQRERARLIDVGGRTETEDHLMAGAVGQLKGDLDRTTGIHAGPEPSRQFPTAHRIRLGEPAVSADERSTIAGQRAPGRVGVDESDPAGEFGVVGIASEQRATGGIDLGDQMHRALGSQIAQHPFHVGGCRESSAPPGRIAHLEHRELHRGVTIDIDPELRAQTLCLVLVYRIAETVPTAITQAVRAG